MCDCDPSLTVASKSVATITDNFQPARVLVVDDDVTVRLLAGGALEGGGFSVIEAGDGESALALFNSRKPDIVLLDVLMPGMDGFETCRALRECPGGEHTPILMMTGLDDVDSINRAYEAGATDFAPKPINYALLDHRVRYMLRAMATAEELRQSQARLASAQRIARLAYWEWNAGTHLVNWSEEIYRLCGRASDHGLESIDGFVDIVHPDDRQRVSSALHALLNHDQPYTLEHRVVHQDGSERVVYQEGQCIPGYSGSGKRFIGTLQDITQRKDAEQRIYHLSHFDSLTGLPNRGFVKEYLHHVIAAATRNHSPIALLSIGINNIQRLNDT